MVGQHSWPVSIAARSLRQNSSSCFWRRAIASTLPSSMTRFRFDMIPPPTIRVSVTLRLVGSSPALAEESIRDFEVLVSPVPKAHQAMWAFSGLAHVTHALFLPSEQRPQVANGEVAGCVRPAPSASIVFGLGRRGDVVAKPRFQLGFDFDEILGLGLEVARMGPLE